VNGGTREGREVASLRSFSCKCRACLENSQAGSLGLSFYSASWELALKTATEKLELKPRGRRTRGGGLSSPSALGKTRTTVDIFLHSLLFLLDLHLQLFHQPPRLGFFYQAINPNSRRKGRSSSMSSSSANVRSRRTQPLLLFLLVLFCIASQAQGELFFRRLELGALFSRCWGSSMRRFCSRGGDGGRKEEKGRRAGS